MLEAYRIKDCIVDKESESIRATLGDPVRSTVAMHEQNCVRGKR